MAPYAVVGACSAATYGCEETIEILGKRLEAGDTLLKVAYCAKHYGVALFRSGCLILLAPGSPEYHGSTVQNGEDNVKDVAAGDTHIVFCKEDGTVHSFGYSNIYGQLGDGSVWTSHKAEGGEDSDDRVPALSAPKMISGFGNGSYDVDGGDVIEGRRLCVPITAVSCGSHHTLLMTRKCNAVYGCGLGLSGQLGGKRKPPLQASFKSIRLLFGLPIRQIAAAGNHSFVLLQTGKLLAFGDNTSGQLGLGSTKAVGTPTPVTIRSVSPQPRGNENLDSYAIKTLRAAWGSAESMYFPLRVERISPELGPGEARIVSIWCSANRSVLLTSDMDWLSCGLPISRSRCIGDGQQQRMDRYGALGRWIKDKRESTWFGKMRWSERLGVAIKTTFPSLAGDALLEAARSEVRLVCFNHFVVLLIPGKDASNKSLLFLQGEGQSVEAVQGGERLSVAAVARADKLLQDREVDDDSCEYALSGGHAIVATDHFLAVI
ncbi:chromatin binding protein, putative [Trypanosoma equiperdum]|uniref:Chromatin binding protein, putative n=1 Tax=Trypanosoma equiperdum TaxID=5694 RepID=A0A1G4IJB4_TRYEQ|nr:chromatin binding protein, putative [Trypanosoma equiperdum]